MTLHRIFLSLPILAAVAALPLAGCATTSSPAPAAAPPQALLPLPTDPGTAIDRIIAAHGGKEALAKVQAYAFAGTLLDKTTFHSDPVEVPFSRTFSRPDRLRVEIDRAEGSEVRIWDGNRGWRNSPDGGDLVEVDGNPLQSMILQAARAALPWILEEKRPVIRLVNPITLVATADDGTKSTSRMVVLEVPLSGEMYMKVLADESTYRIVGAGGYLRPTDRSPLFETHYGRYVTVGGGVLFPTYEQTFVGKMSTGTQLITTVTLDPVLKGSEFKP
jgi:hypothetical protein